MPDMPPLNIRPRRLDAKQQCEVWIASISTGESELVFSTTDKLLEAPNWTIDGDFLILNGDGKLWALNLKSRELTQVPVTGISDLNNDHVLDPDGKHIYLSANDGHIYKAPLGGGDVHQVSPDDGWFHFLHGVSPDGRQLAYVGIGPEGFGSPGVLMTIPSAGGNPTRIETGKGHVDGPEYSPDGIWLYLNAEAFTSTVGHAQIARIKVDGSDFQRLLTSETVDWFPHLSPDGRLAAYLRFPPGTKGHPANLLVEVVVVHTSTWSEPLHVWPIFGGQGTLNVNSWSPDSKRIAYVAYPYS